MALNAKVCEVITDRVIALIEERKELIWNRCWECIPQMNPRNLDSNKPYKGINWFLASAIYPEHPYFLTANKVTARGGKIKKGEKALPIVFFSYLHLDENGKKLPKGKESEAARKVPVLRYYNVFNQTQIEGIEFPEIEKVSFTEKERIENCEKIVLRNKKLRGLKVKEVEQNRAFYTPSADAITMPSINQFKTSELYYGTLFHEMIHWTGHESRLNRFKYTGTSFGSKSYSAEELVAEIGAASLAAHTQIQSPEMIENNAAYLKGWLARLKEDPTFLVQSSFDSQKAVDLISSEE
tara:strand:- start:3667 stop:4554 length:888 start_codon:yes stop_codon:yes gene_type:complete